MDMMANSNGLRWVAGAATPQRVYITRVMNYGTWEEWKELLKTHSKEYIVEAMRHPLRGQWTMRGKAFAETIFSYTMPKDAILSYDA